MVAVVGGGWWVSASSGRTKGGKSVSLTGGAGAEGVALRVMAMGGRAEVVRVGAVEPERRPVAADEEPWGRADLSPSFFAPLELLGSRGVGLTPPLAASWADFLFFRSMDMLWPGRMWARAHLWPNLQFPLTNQAQQSFCWPGSLWEKGQEEPAVQAPTLKNLQGTWERSFAVEGISGGGDGGRGDGHFEEAGFDLDRSLSVSLSSSVGDIVVADGVAR